MISQLVEKNREAGSRKTVVIVNNLTVTVTSNEPSEEAIDRFNEMFVGKVYEGKIK